MAIPALISRGFAFGKLLAGPLGLCNVAPAPAGVIAAERLEWLDLCIGKPSKD